MSGLMFGRRVCPAKGQRPIISGAGVSLPLDTYFPTARGSDMLSFVSAIGSGPARGRRRSPLI
eukprot:10396240-Lingulodinium_polyedra.AAC.1